MTKPYASSQTDREDPIQSLTKLMIERFDHVDQELSDVKSKTRTIRRDVDDLLDRTREMSGYAKEIDVLMERVSNVERHLGINHEITS
jgi:hypothetical protein